MFWRYCRIILAEPEAEPPDDAATAPALAICVQKEKIKKIS
jgi:hypothetical protein